ncbi:hypothetical protein EDC04DRAFT_2610793 [Pisolithus marmoratus]|nr:hypothetical protein EDC04DRAFT_2610793 [Pisolithus marmoratus]
MSSQAHYQVKQRWCRSLVLVGRSLLVDYDIYAKIDGRPPNRARGLGGDPVLLGRDSLLANSGKIRQDNFSNGVPEVLCIGNISEPLPYCWLFERGTFIDLVLQSLRVHQPPKIFLEKMGDYHMSLLESGWRIHEPAMTNFLIAILLWHMFMAKPPFRWMTSLGTPDKAVFQRDMDFIEMFLLMNQYKVMEGEERGSPLLQEG